MNRAVRRQQRAAEAKQKAAAGRSSSAIPKTGTPSRSQQQRTASSSRGGLLGWRPRWIMDIISELKKVVWPTREDTLYMAVVVVIVTLIFGALLGAIDFFFAYVIDKAILDPNAWLK